MTRTLSGGTCGGNFAGEAVAAQNRNLVGRGAVERIKPDSSRLKPARERIRAARLEAVPFQSANIPPGRRFVPPFASLRMGHPRSRRPTARSLNLSERHV